MIKKVLVCFIATSIGLSPVLASLPEPLIHLDFEENLQNKGSAGEVAYLPWPEFTNSFAMNKKALDLTAVDQVGVKLGREGNTVQQALDGLKSFTICMWVRFEELPGTRSYLWTRKHSDPYNYILRLYQDQWGRPRQTVNMYEGSLSPYAYWGLLDKWQFVAVTYDGTLTSQNEIFYKKIIGGTSMEKVIRDHDAGVLDSSNFHIEFGEKITGQIDEVRLYGSKTDSSGVLSQSQLEEIFTSDQEGIFPGPAFEDPFGALIYMPFENNWNNYGSAQPDSAEVSLINGIQPQFGIGLRQACLDLSAAVMGQNAGCVNFGFAGDEETAVEAALNGLKSFTICGWFNTVDPYNTLTVNTGLCGRLGQVMLRSYDSDCHLVLGVNNQWTPTDDDVVFCEADQWVFYAVTYDSTKASDQVLWYKGTQTPQDGVVFLKSHNLSAGTLVTQDDEFTVANLLASGAYSFSGFFDEFRLFGSKSDSTGALDILQLQAVYEYSLLPVCGETEHPRPTGEINGDCIVNLMDLSLIGLNWLRIPLTNN